MKDKLTVKQAENILRDSLKDNKPKLYHSIKVSKYGYLIAKKIKQKHPELKIDLKEVRILGLLHDIGRKNTEWIKHFFESGKMLRKLNLNYYAKKVETHGPAPEISKILKIKGDFYPKTIEEKILSFADAHYKKNKFVTIKKRFSDKGFIKIQKKYPKIAKVVKNKSISRRKKIFREIKKLLK
jgi:putative nucleotidyltransferase with HDIG domain